MTRLAVFHWPSCTGNPPTSHMCRSLPVRSWPHCCCIVGNLVWAAVLLREKLSLFFFLFLSILLNMLSWACAQVRRTFCDIYLWFFLSSLRHSSCCRIAVSRNARLLALPQDNRHLRLFDINGVRLDKSTQKRVSC